MENNEIYTKMENAMIIVDKLLPLLPEYNVFHFSYYAKEKLQWKIKDVQEITMHAPYIKRLMIENLRYVNEVTEGQLYELTDKGRQAKAAGGHYAYLKELDEKKLEENVRKKLSDEKLKYDVKNSKRMFKTYWWTFSFALIGLIISLVLGILKVIEWLTPSQNS